MINFKKMDNKEFSIFLKKQQYPPAAGATQGNTAYTQNVSLNGKIAAFKSQMQLYVS